MKITFLGAVEEVTGSRYLVEHNNTRILVDCGMFQGPKAIAQRNNDPFPVDPKSIDAIVLTHAHIDHTGYIPVLVKNGFSGTIYCSKGTYALASLLLVNSGGLQEGEARAFNMRGGPDHPPAVALYTEQDAQNSLKFFQTVEYDAVTTIGAFSVTLIRSGHILGSNFVVVSDGSRTLTFSGDLGRPHDLIMKAPPHLTQTDFLVIESTYGARVHDSADPLKTLAAIINETVKKNGVLVLPCFAVARTQTILYCLYELKQRNAIPNIPIFLDSPLAMAITNLMCEFKDEYTLPGTLCKDIATVATYTPTREASMALDGLDSPAIIVAGSGMADGGRVVFHLREYLADHKNTILFVGYQAEGTAGHALVTGAKTIEIQGDDYPVRAEIKVIDIFSAHADSNEILEWLSYFATKPKKVFVTHGEMASAHALQKKIQERFGWDVVVPSYLDSFDLV